MLRLVGVTLPDDVDIYNGMRMIKGLETRHSTAKIERILTQAGLYSLVEKQVGNKTRKEKVYPKVGNLTWKQKSRLIELVDMPRAKITRVPMSPRKMRLVADVIRGKKVDEALAILQFMPKSGAPVLLKLLESAIANAGNNHNLKADDLFVAKILVDGGPTLRRFRARARGRACRIRKRSCHALIVLRETFKMAKISQQPSGSAAPAAAKVKKSAVVTPDTSTQKSTTSTQGGNE